MTSKGSQKFSGRKHSDVEQLLHSREVSFVKSHQYLGPPVHSTLQYAVIPGIGEKGAPEKVNRLEIGQGDKIIHNAIDFLWGEACLLQKVFSLQNAFIFQYKRNTYDRRKHPLIDQVQHLTRRTCCRADPGPQDVGVQNDAHGLMVSHMTPASKFSSPVSSSR